LYTEDKVVLHWPSTLNELTIIAIKKDTEISVIFFMMNCILWLLNYIHDLGRPLPFTKFFAHFNFSLSPKQG
jgi:hypothetical protein